MINSRLNRRNFLAVTAGGIVTLASISAFAGGRVSKTNKGIAIKGYDTTAYFQKGKPGKGNSKTVVEWNGAEWRFATAAEATLFQADPTAYAPQFGGYCTRAMSFKSLVHSNPKVWRIYNGKLYLFAASKGGKFFDKGQDKMIEKAQAHWDSLS
jgi:YHS domain-containing protein